MNKTLKLCLMWILVCCFYFYEYLVQIMPNVLAPDLIHDFQINSIELGILGSAYFLMYVIIQIPSGILLDKLGVRYSLIIASLACAAGLFIFGSTHSFTVALLARALTGFGGGFAFIASMKVAGDWLPFRFFPLLAALTLTIGTCGASFGNYIVAKLKMTLSWQSITFLFAFIGFVIFLLVVLTIFDPNRAKQIQIKTRFAEFWRELKVSKNEILKVMQKKNNWLASLYMSLFYAPISALGTMWGHSFSIVKFHLTDSEHDLISAFLFLGMALGGPLIGLLTQFVFSFYQVLFAGGLLTLITLIYTLYLAPTIFMAHLSMFIYGIVVSSFTPIFVIISKQNIQTLKATSIAFLNMMSMILGGIAFQPLIGYLLEKFSSNHFENGIKVYQLIDYEKALAILPVSIVLSLCFLFMLWWRDRIHKKKRDELYYCSRFSH